MRVSGAVGARRGGNQPRTAVWEAVPGDRASKLVLDDKEA